MRMIEDIEVTEVRRDRWGRFCWRLCSVPVSPAVDADSLNSRVSDKRWPRFYENGDEKVNEKVKLLHSCKPSTNTTLREKVLTFATRKMSRVTKLQLSGNKSKNKKKKGKRAWQLTNLFLLLVRQRHRI